MNKRVKAWLESFLYAFITLFILFFLCWPFEISGDSMRETFVTGERIAVSRLAARLFPIEHGDIVVCELSSLGQGYRVVKRVVGLPGERVTIKDGGLFIDGEAVDEPYTGGKATTGELDLLLAPGEYYVLGDNRPASADSRMNGPVNGERVIAKVVARWFPLQKFELFT